MTEGAISIKKAIPIIVVTWILSLITTLAVVYIAPNIFPPLPTEKIANGVVTTDKIADGAIVTIKLADGSVTSVKILDGSVAAVDLSDGSVMTAKIADGAVTTAKIADGAVTSAKILDGTITTVDLAIGAVTNTKLASKAIPFNSTYNTSQESTTSTSWVDMPGMLVSLTLERTSHLLILFSAEVSSQFSGGIYPPPTVLARALVGDSVAIPGEIALMSSSYALPFNSHSYVFYKPNVASGQYLVKIQWRVSGESFSIGHRTLTVIALPA